MPQKKYIVITILNVLLWVGGLWYLHSAFIQSGRYELDRDGRRISWMETEGYKIAPLTIACAVLFAVSISLAKSRGGSKSRNSGPGSGVPPVLPPEIR